jgi:hypothetical protein
MTDAVVRVQVTAMMAIPAALQVTNVSQAHFVVFRQQRTLENRQGKRFAGLHNVNMKARRSEPVGHQRQLAVRLAQVRQTSARIDNAVSIQPMGRAAGCVHPDNTATIQVSVRPNPPISSIQLHDIMHLQRSVQWRCAFGRRA